MKIGLLFRGIAVVGTLSLALLLSDWQPIQSQPSQLASSHLNKLQLNFMPPPPPVVGAPTGRRRGGSSRGVCKKYESLTALVPVAGESVWGLTSAERPTFWFFVPEALTANLPIEFVLQDEADNYIYKTTVRGSEMRSGIVSLSVPPTIAPLEIGKPYRWTFSLYCDRNKPSASVFVQGSIQRVPLAPTLQRQLETAMPRERINLYAANGIWHDALTNLAQLRQTNPEDAALIADWESLLKSVGLEAITTEPIVQCCTLEN
jgi:hypothetical protein